MKMEKVVTLGCDPEIFVSSARKPRSAHDLLPGTKKFPYKVAKGAVQIDGTAVEFNIEPASTSEEWTGNISTVLTEMKHLMTDKDDKVGFTWIPVRKYSKTLWNSLPDSAKEMGCDPDYNAYTGLENPRPECAIPTLRSAGGHIHIGWCKDADINDPRHIIDCRLMVSAMDAFVFPYSKSWDTDETRRLLYGKPGAYRVKPYGVEYRTLSNMWVRKENTQKFIWAATRHVSRILIQETYDAGLSNEFARLFREAAFGKEAAYKEITGGLFLSKALKDNRYGALAIDFFAKKYLGKGYNDGLLEP